MRWSNRLGWTFRAVIKIDGIKRVGPARLDQEQAAEDYRRLRVHAKTLPRHIVTLDEAIAQVVAEAYERGVPEATVKKSTMCHGAYLMRWWKAGARMSEITKGEVMWFVREARNAGRSPNTLIQKDLPLLGRCFEVAGLRNHVPEVRRELRQTLKRVPPTMSYLEPEELIDLLKRMRDAVFRRVEVKCPNPKCKHAFTTTLEDRDGDQPQVCPRPKCRKRFTVKSRRRGRVLKIASRALDADLVEFLALTGIRAGELGRIRLGDIDDRRKRIPVVSKDRGHPRHVEVVGRLKGIVDRLRDAARARAGEGADFDSVLLVHDSMNRITNLCRRWKGRLDEKRLSGRTLRHTFVTGLLYSGAEAVEAKGLAGHRNLSTTDRYTHEISRRRVDVLESWQRRLAGEDDARAAAGSS